MLNEFIIIIFICKTYFFSSIMQNTLLLIRWYHQSWSMYAKCIKVTNPPTLYKCVCVRACMSWHIKWRHTGFTFPFPNNAKWSNLLHFVAKISFLMGEITFYHSKLYPILHFAPYIFWMYVLHLKLWPLLYFTPQHHVNLLLTWIEIQCLGCKV